MRDVIRWLVTKPVSLGEEGLGLAASEGKGIVLGLVPYYHNQTFAGCDNHTVNPETGYCNRQTLIGDYGTCAGFGGGGGVPGCGCRAVVAWGVALGGTGGCTGGWGIGAATTGWATGGTGACGA